MDANRFAASLQRLEERFLSCFFCDPAHGLEVCHKVGLTDDRMLAYIPHRGLMRAIIDWHDKHAPDYTGEPAGILLRAAEFSKVAGPAAAAIITKQSSSAGIENYARLIVSTHRRRERLSRAKEALARRAEALEASIAYFAL